MSVLFAALSRGAKNAPPLEIIKAALPHGIVESSSVSNGRAVLHCVKYGSASDNDAVESDGWHMEVSGLLSGARKASLIGDLTVRYADGGVPLSSYPTQFCALGIGHDEIVGFIGAPGTDQLFTYEDDDFVVVTNRHNLIALVIPEHKAKVRRDALILTLVQDHIRDSGTAIDGVMRTAPGAVIRAGTRGVRRGPAASKAWEHGIGHGDLIRRIEDLTTDYSDALGRFDRIELGISGGKDSRAILGLLMASGVSGDRLRLFTGGEPYSPDVMSAQDVVEAAGLSGQHTISAPSFSLKESFGDSLSWDLWVDSAGTSLADFRQPPGKNLGVSGVRVGGHEIGFKQLPNELELEPYLESRVRPWLNHPLVKGGTCEHIAGSFVSRTREILRDAPARRYNAIDLAMNHIALHTSSTQTASHIGNFEVHPLLDARFLELLVGASDELVASQFIHFVLMRKSGRALELPAFANDEWPKALATIASDASIPFRGTPEKPYRFLDFFPSQSGFGRHAWRFRLYGLYIPWIKEYIHSSRSRLDFLDVANVDELLSRDQSNWNFRDIYRIGALLKICLTDHFGIRAWHLSNRKSIEDEINSFAAGSVRGSTLVPSPNDILARTDLALAKSVRLMRLAMSSSM